MFKKNEKVAVNVELPVLKREIPRLHKEDDLADVLNFAIKLGAAQTTVLYWTNGGTLTEYGKKSLLELINEITDRFNYFIK
jgi:hypothetical protein